VFSLSSAPLAWNRPVMRGSTFAPRALWPCCSAAAVVGCCCSEAGRGVRGRCLPADFPELSLHTHTASSPCPSFGAGARVFNARQAGDKKQQRVGCSTFAKRDGKTDTTPV